MLHLFFFFHFIMHNWDYMKINKRLIYIIFTIVVFVLSLMEWSYNVSFWQDPSQGRPYNFPAVSYYLLHVWFYLTGLVILLKAYRNFKRKKLIWVFFLLLGLVWLLSTHYIVFIMMIVISPTV